MTEERSGGEVVGEGGVLRAKALEMLAGAAEAANSHGRPDLAERLDVGLAELADPRVRIMVVGEFKAGKSSLVNAMVGLPVCPVDDDFATSVHTAVRYSPEAVATVVFEPGNAGDEPRRQDIAFENVAEHVSEGGNPENTLKLRAVEVGVPAPALAGGLVVVDTPGLGGLGSSYSAPTLAAIPYADGVLFTSDASQEYIEPELRFLEAARDAGAVLIGVLTKIDFYPEWRRIRDLNLAHLERAEIDAPLVATSAALRERGIARGDPDLYAESGYAELLAQLQARVVATAEAGAARRAAANVLSVTGQLESILVAEEEATDPERAEAVVAAMALAHRRAQELAGPAARWRQVLDDGIADLQSDEEHELHTRLRNLAHAADARIDASDPTSTWDEFQQWLSNEVASLVAECHLTLSRSATELAAAVSEEFAAGQCELTLSLEASTPSAGAEVLVPGGSMLRTQLRSSDRGLVMLEGSWSALEPLAALGGVVGLGLLNPLTLVVGAFVGRRALRDDKTRKVEAQRDQAKTTYHSWLEEVRLEVGKELKDRIRRVQRKVRDDAAARASELERSMAEALAAAKAQVEEAAGRGPAEARRRELAAELENVRRLRDAAVALAPTLLENETRSTNG